MQHDAPVEAPAGPKVLATATSAHGKVMRSIEVVRPQPRDASFIAATAKGLGITIKHFARNLFSPLRSAAGRARAGAPVEEHGFFGRKNDIETVQYPEEKVTYPERFRGLHRLMLRDDGAVRCDAC